MHSNYIFPSMVHAIKADHEKRSISLVSTQFYHFHFHPLAGLDCYPHLISCLKQQQQHQQRYLREEN